MRAFWWTLAGICSLYGLLVFAALDRHYSTRLFGADVYVGEPYACFGGGRYDAMARGITCEDERAKLLPYYLDPGKGAQ